MSLALTLLLAATPAAAPRTGQTPVNPAQPSPPPATQTSPAGSVPSSVPKTGSQTTAASTLELSEGDLARIRRGVAQEPTFKIDEQRLRFYVQVLAKQVSFAAQFARGYDWKNGATRGGNPMTHQEFLNMVTPKEMYSSAGITATDQLQFALTNWVGKALIKKALTDISNARSERELQDIRDRIDRELALLRRGGG